MIRASAFWRPPSLGRLNALGCDARGIALVEFAISLPILLVLYLGGYQISDAIACNRKVTITTRAITDLVAQNTTGSTSATEVDSDLAATTQVMLPYPAANAQVRVSEVYTDLTTTTKVQWSRSVNGTARAVNSTIVIPAAMRVPGTYMLLAEATYGYRPPVLYGIVGPLSLSDTIYMLPRNTSSISCSDC